MAFRVDIGFTAISAGIKKQADKIESLKALDWITAVFFPNDQRFHLTNIQNPLRLSAAIVAIVALQ